MKIGNDDRKTKRKMLRLLCFLLSGLLVMTVSASVYNYMHMQGAPISVETPKVRFVDGPDASCTVGTNGTYVKITDMAGWPNATRVYEDAVRIEELASATQTCELMFDSWSGNIGEIDYIYVKVFDGATQKGSTLSVTVGNSTETFSLSALATYRVQWEIKWKGGALSTYTVDVTLKLKVT